MANKPISVTNVLNYSVFIDKGRKDKVKKGQKYIIYSVSDEIIVDATTRKALGNLEIVKGIGEVIHVEDHRAILHSNEFEPVRITKRSSLGSPEGSLKEETYDGHITKAFRDVKVGDLVKRIF